MVKLAIARGMRSVCVLPTSPKHLSFYFTLLFKNVKAAKHDGICL